jgi:hypothetical protein
MEHAPLAEYQWVFGDDDVPYPGALDRTLTLLREHRPVWLFHPYEYVDGSGAVTGAIPMPADPAPALYPDAAALWNDRHQYKTFLSASVVRADALREAARATTAENG